MNPPPVEVLHVEDDDDWAGLVDHWLSSRGYKVRRLSSCAEARSYLAGCRDIPDCVLLDQHLRDGDGTSVCAEMKRSPAFQRIPVVIMTGLDLPASQFLRHGALYRVMKGPGAEEELAAVVASVLHQAERSQGVLDVGDVRLDPRDHTIVRAGSSRVFLDEGNFAAFRLLVYSSPQSVGLHDLYNAFLRRHAYKKEDPELAVLHTARNYVSKLRAALGPIGDRIKAVRGEGYRYESSATKGIFEID